MNLYEDPTQKRLVPETEDANYAFHFASECIDRGFSVIPMRGKVPAIPWKKYQSQRASAEDVATWFGGGANERFNLGIVTGNASSLVVLDADARDDALFWYENRPRTPLMVRSGGGGVHFYYQLRPEAKVRNRTRVLARSLDVRGEGGVIVAPPSLHPESGKRYAWVNTFSDFRLADVPFFENDWVGRSDVSSEQPRLDFSFAPSSPIRNVRAWIYRVKAISGQGGHNATFRVACKLRDAGLSPEEALSEIITWSESCASPPWSRRQLEHKILSAFSQRPAG